MITPAFSFAEPAAGARNVRVWCDLCTHDREAHIEISSNLILYMEAVK